MASLTITIQALRELAGEVGPSSVVVVFVPEDGPSRISVGGDFVGCATGNASSGSVRASFNTGGTWLAFLSSMVLRIVLQSGTNVCASGLKHVIVAVAVPSSIIALKQYLLIVVMSILSCGPWLWHSETSELSDTLTLQALSENLQVILSMYCMGKTAKQC
ncbi:hypothetical protein Tco_0343508 [Tanacetum coccineum]